MNLRLVRFRSVGLASLSLFEPDDPCPAHARVVDLAVGLIVRGMTLGPTDAPASRVTVTVHGATLGTEPLDAARLDAAITLAERGRDTGSHDCGGA